MGLLRKIVKNEAMRRDPPEIYGWRVILMACTVRRTRLNRSRRYWEFAIEYKNWLTYHVLYRLASGVCSSVWIVEQLEVFWSWTHLRSEHPSPTCIAVLIVSRAFGLEGISKDAAATLSANIVSALQAGCFLGAVMAWPLADLIGRKPSLIISPVVAAIGIAMQAASFGNLPTMYVGRYDSLEACR